MCQCHCKLAIAALVLAFVEFAVQIVVLSPDFQFTTIFNFISFGLSIGIFATLLIHIVMGRKPKIIIQKEVEMDPKIVYLPIDSSFDFDSSVVFNYTQ